MLQQTQVSRVLQKYPRFLKRFPTIRSLARSTTAGVIRAWRGMGYNNRAVRLRDLAREVLRKYIGRIPRTPEELMELPGIGRYTANAISCFAFGQRVPVVDTNIARVLTRLNPGAGKDVWALAQSALPTRDAYTWNQALMELGAVVCASTPRCISCPLSSLCPSASRIRRPLDAPPRPERGRNGIPNRIYRGRIVDFLRSRPHTLAEIARKLEVRSQRDRRWLAGVMASLGRDGLVRRSANGLLALPK